MIQTFIGYGYNLGGPGRWHLKGVAPGAPLRTPWFDETDPRHDFPDRALAEIISGVTGVQLTRQQQNRIESGIPYHISAAIDMSPPGWTREASAPPTPSAVLPPSAAGYALDEPAALRFVLVVLDSIEDVDANAGAPTGAPPWPGDWAILLDAALTELGLQAAGTPDWLWFRTGTPD
jgi:hypothetical protein